MGRCKVSLSPSRVWFTAACAVSAGIGSAASAEITLSQLIVELTPGSAAKDVEVFNDSDERAYVTIAPREIIRPGQADESSSSPADPERLGLLVSPRKLILEPHQRRLIRIAGIGSTSFERVYRITVKPDVGDIKADATGLKLLVGYDMLVIARPAVSQSANLVGVRAGNQLTISNLGNASVELDGGQQCRVATSDCRDLGGKRLYAGASWKVTLPFDTLVRFKARDISGWVTKSF